LPRSKTQEPKEIHVIARTHQQLCYRVGLDVLIYLVGIVKKLSS
jgi:hypothetical protein